MKKYVTNKEFKEMQKYKFNNFCAFYCSELVLGSCKAERPTIPCNNSKIFRFLNKKSAFSLVEILVALIIVSLIMAAMAPVITKKLSSAGITIVGGGSGGGAQCATCPDGYTLQGNKCIGSGITEFNYAFSGYMRDASTNAKIKLYLYKSGNFVAKTTAKGTIFLVGGGGAGGYKNYAGAGGGGGGFTSTETFQFEEGVTYSVTIGAGATTTGAKGGTTAFGNRSAAGGNGASGNVGGTGGGRGGNGDNPGSDGVEFDGEWFAGGGGGGGLTDGHKGGNCCGGKGRAHDSNAIGGAGQANTGGGGGGGGGAGTGGDCSGPTGGAGGSGVVIILFEKASDPIEPTYENCTGGSSTAISCDDGYFFDSDTTTCLPCPSGYYCKNNAKTPCPEGTISHGGAVECSVYEEITYVSSGSHSFVVPANVNELFVTLVSGGAGGGGGKTQRHIDTFVTYGTGNHPAGTYNTLYTTASGIVEWTIPEKVKGKNVLVSACGGGGGGGSAYSGANGGIITGVSVPMPVDEDTIKIHIGGGGGTVGQMGTCSNGGSGGTYTNPGCNSQTYGAGGVRCYYQDCLSHGYGGYDPVYSLHEQGGQVDSSIYNSGTLYGSRGSYIGGGGGGATDATNEHDLSWEDQFSYSGGGGAATLFLHQDYANVSDYVAHGGNGGASRYYYSGTEWQYRMPGGGGGGAYKANIGSSVFGEGYCAGGSPYVNGQSGAMRLEYTIGLNGGTGGGAGQIVPEQSVSVTPGETLTVVVGVGGKGGNIDTAGESMNESMISKIVNSSNQILLSTTRDLTTAGTTGGNFDGTTVGVGGYITNGKNATAITATGYSSSNGAAANGFVGGAGGKITLFEDGEMPCSAGGGGADNTAGGNASTYGGCGGGGGGAGEKGGDGSAGYVIIRYLK